MGGVWKLKQYFLATVPVVEDAAAAAAAAAAADDFFFLEGTKPERSVRSALSYLHDNVLVLQHIALEVLLHTSLIPGPDLDQCCEDSVSNAVLLLLLFITLGSMRSCTAGVDFQDLVSRVRAEQ